MNYKQKETVINNTINTSSVFIVDFFRKEISETRETVNDLIRDNRKRINIDKK